MIFRKPAAALALVFAFLLLIPPLASRAQGDRDGRRGGGGDFMDSANGLGVSRTLTTARVFDRNNPFFQPLGANGRACATCHPVSEGMTITPDYAQRVFDATRGLDPLFAPVDGTNAPNADVSTIEARRKSSSLLLTKGLFRIGLPVPANAEFTIDAVDDPYGYARPGDVSCFRRPLPATNLRFLASVMWDGRELAGQNSIHDALASQARDAVLGHMQAAAPPTGAQVEAIVAFETALYTSQIYDNAAGILDAPRTGAGPSVLVDTPYVPGINDAFGLTGNRRGDRSPFDPDVFTFYADWLKPEHGRTDPLTAARAAVARGEKLFNTKTFAITDVAGLNDVVNKGVIVGTCSSCHSTPRVGSLALPLLLNTGIADGARRTPDMPLYALRNKRTGALVSTTDPGAALTTGKWADIGKFKVPSLRGLETHSPYMHNGFSGEVRDVLDFYDTRFRIGLSPTEKSDLKAFLVTL